MPILCLLIIHFNNFNSFKNEEILYCEYSEDGRSSTINSYAGMLFADSADKEKIIDRDSQYRSQLLTSEAALNSEVELFEESSTDSDDPDDLDKSPVNSLATSLSLGLGLKKSKTTRKSKKKLKSKAGLSIHPSSINSKAPMLSSVMKASDGSDPNAVDDRPTSKRVSMQYLKWSLGWTV